MNPEAKKAVPDDTAESGMNTETESTDVTDRPMSLHDRVVIGLALGVALVLCILLGTVLRVPGS